MSVTSDAPTPGFAQVAIVKPDTTTGTEGLSVRLANGHTIEEISSHTLPLVSKRQTNHTLAYFYVPG